MAFCETSFALCAGTGNQHVNVKRNKMLKKGKQINKYVRRKNEKLNANATDTFFARRL